MTTPFLRCVAITAATTSLACFGLAGTAHAQSTGSLLLRLGATQIKPQVSSGDLSAPSLAGTQVDVKADTQVGGGLTYLLSDHLSIDLPLAVPFKHDIVGDGAIAGAGKIGEVKVLPVTLMGQYRFLSPAATVRPYLGAGVTYARFFKARGTAVLTAITGGSPAQPTTLEVASRFGATFQLGASVALGDRWGIDASVAKTTLKTTTQLSTGQSIDLKLDPLSVSLAASYRF